MVDLLSIFSIIVIVIALPTVLILAGRFIAIFTSLRETGSETQKPDKEIKGKAMIVYEPGATKLTRKIGEELGDLLLERGYEVTLAGIRSEAAKDTKGYNLLILGTPTYIGRPTGFFKKYVKDLHQEGDQIIGIYLGGTKGAPAVGFVPKSFLDTMKKPFEASAIRVREMAFIGYKGFDYAAFVSVLLDPQQVQLEEPPAPATT